MCVLQRGRGISTAAALASSVSLSRDTDLDSEQERKLGAEKQHKFVSRRWWLLDCRRKGHSTIHGGTSCRRKGTAKQRADLECSAGQPLRDQAKTPPGQSSWQAAGNARLQHAVAATPVTAQGGCPRPLLLRWLRGERATCPHFHSSHWCVLPLAATHRSHAYGTTLLCSLPAVVASRGTLGLLFLGQPDQPALCVHAPTCKHPCSMS